MRANDGPDPYHLHATGVAGNRVLAPVPSGTPPGGSAGARCLFAAARCHSSAGAYLARETPFEIMLLSMLVEQQKQLVALTRKVADLETRLPADPPARVAS